MSGRAVRGLMPVVRAADVRPGRPEPVQPEALRDAAAMLEEIRLEGEPAVRRHAQRLGELQSKDEPLVVTPGELSWARDAAGPGALALLERTAERIAAFAQAQRQSVQPVDVAIPGGRASQQIAPVHAAGCYAPGGRYPLPSSVLMTAVTARVAGCATVVVASPRPSAATLAAASVAGADVVLRIGGVQAIGAMAFGLPGVTPACDAIVGPGNRYVTAAKQLVSGRVRIDMLAGPSELLILADDSADPAVLAADLLAQAEHDADARAMLVTTERAHAAATMAALHEQLAALPTSETARLGLANGFIAVADSMDEAVTLSDRIAPEHLELHCRDASVVADRLRHYGGLFIGAASAEVLGDYGAGPNHTLPTGGTARSYGGLSVFDFLRIRTTLEVRHAAGAAGLYRDAADLARLEGLEAHARSAERRL